MRKYILRTLSICFFLIITLFTHSYSLVEIETINIINNFQYKFEDSSTTTNSTPISIENNKSKWNTFISIKELSKQVKDQSTVWFRVKLPEINHGNQGVYFEQLYAKSLDIYLGINNVHSKHRKIFQDYNSLVLPLSESNSNEYLYLKVVFCSSKIGPSDTVLIGDYSELQYKYLTKNILNVYLGFGFIFISLAILLCSFMLKNNDKKLGISLTFITLSIGLILISFRTNILMLYSEQEPFILLLFDLAMFSFFPNLTYFFELVIISGRSPFVQKFLKTQASYSAFCIIFMLINILMDYKLNNICAFFSIPLIGIFFMIQLVILVGYGVYYAKKGNKNAKIFILGFSSFAILLLSELLIYLLIYRDHNFTMWKWGLISFSISLIIIFGRKFVENHQKVHQYSNQLKSMTYIAKTDFLTNVPNRMDMCDRIQTAIKNYRLHNKEFFLVLCDIDNFKSINDTYGHTFGDEVLVEFVKIIKTTLNKTDIIGRWGGEEFLLIITTLNYEQACNLVEKIRLSVNNHEFNYKDKAIKISATFGLCKYDDLQGLETCLDCIDNALYFGKRNGKNKLVAYEEFEDVIIKDGI